MAENSLTGTTSDETGSGKGYRPSFAQGENTMEVEMGKWDLDHLESMSVSELLHMCKYYRDRVIRLGDAEDVASLQRINDTLAKKIEIPVKDDVSKSIPAKPKKSRTIDSDIQKEVKSAIQKGIRESVASAVYPEIPYRSKRSKVEVEPLLLVNKEEDTIIVSSEADSPLSLPPLLVKKRGQ